MFDLATAISENSSLIKAFWESVGPKVTKLIDREYQKASILFGRHLESSYAKNSSVKLLSSKTTPTPLKEVYVENNFVCRKNDEIINVSDSDFISDIRSGKRVVIRGNGGTGKTFFLKHLWNNIFSDPRGAIPVYIELRKFNDFHTLDLDAFIKYTLTSGKEMDHGVYESLLKSGSLILMFDGFDEVIRERRREVEKQLLSLEEKCPKCPFVVSSRANAMFEGWINFHIYDVAGFDLDQVKKLVNRSTVGKKTKDAFLTVLDEEFYKEHRTFLEIPLLALMMLITFRDTANIPANLDAFYSAVFHTLYQNHDAMKESLVRPKALEIVTMQRFFAAFCFLTYLKEKYEFSGSEILEEIQNSKNFLNKNTQFNTDVKASNQQILDDIEEAVNLIHLDGLSYLFVHRSFQEYFTAYFAIKMEEEKTAALLELFAERTFDSIMKICYQMKPAAMINKFVLPKYEKFESLSYFSNIDSFTDALMFLDNEGIYFSLVRNKPKNKKEEKKFGFASLRTIKWGGGWSNFVRVLNQIEMVKLKDWQYPSEASDVLVSNLERWTVKWSKQFFKDTDSPVIFFKFSNSGIVAIRGDDEMLYNNGFEFQEDDSHVEVDIETFDSEMHDELMDLILTFSKSELQNRKKLQRILRGFQSKSNSRLSKSIEDLYEI